MRYKTPKVPADNAVPCSPSPRVKLHDVNIALNLSPLCQIQQTEVPGASLPPS